MVFPKAYKVLNQNSFSKDEYSIVPIRYEDRFVIMNWRNEQMYHLRQSSSLTKEDQENYFRNVVAKLFEQEKPEQILFSYLQDGICIGYGGLVHINWIDRNAEISFIMKTALEKNEFEEHWGNYLDLLELVAFKELNFHKLFTYAFDLRPHLYKSIETKGYVKEALLKEHCFFEGAYKDVIIHSKLNNLLSNMETKKINKDSYSFSNFTDLELSENELVWKWRNDEAIRKWMYTSEIIEFENHLKFIEKLKITNTKFYYLVKRNQVPIGVFSIVDIKDQIGEWGYYIAPELHNRSLGVEFYYYVLQFVFETLNFKKIIGYALIKNTAANSLNGLFGFTKKLTSKSENNEIKEYYYRELFSEVWYNETKTYKKIHRLLELTQTK